MDDYVTKPISGDVLAEVIQRWWPKALSREPESGDRLVPSQNGAVSSAAEPQQHALDPNVRRSDAVAKIFLKHVPAQIESIGQALTDEDEATLKAAAHKLKGSCLAVGVPRMAELCAAIEEGNGDLGPLFGELKAVYALAEQELSAQLGGKPKSVAS